MSGEKFVPRTIHVAPPDHHMLIDGDTATLVRSPKENRSRPAIDPLFRSAAQHHPHRAIGIILSGLLDDGRAGIWFLGKTGGVAIIQTPADCLYPDMPLNAASETNIDHKAIAAEMGDLLKRLCDPTDPKPPEKTLRNVRGRHLLAEQ